MNYNQENIPNSITPEKKLDVMKCFDEGWQYFKLNPWLAIGVVVLFYVLMAVIMFIPILGFIAMLIITPAFTGGMAFFFLNLARNSEPKVENVFAGFSDKFVSLLGAYWLIVLISIVLLLPSIIYIIVLAGGDFFNSNLSSSIGLSFFAIYLINIIVVVGIMVRFYFVYFLLMDYKDLGVIDAFKASAELMRGNVWKVILYAIVAYILIVVGLLLLVIPGIIAALVAGIGFTRIYLNLKEIKGFDRPIEPTTSPPTYSPPPPESSIE